MADTRERVHALVDLLPPAQLQAVAGLLETMIDDEPVTEEERRLLAEGDAWLAAGGKCTSMEDVLAEFGLQPSDSPLKK